MSKKNVNELFKKYPHFFDYMKDYEGPMMPIQFGIECNNGWYDILDDLMKAITDHCDSSKFPYPKVTQIKEKFGGLRFYINGGDDTIDKLINAAEVLSYKTCEDCGTTENVFQTKGWIRVTCPRCNDIRTNKTRDDV